MKYLRRNRIPMITIAIIVLGVAAFFLKFNEVASLKGMLVFTQIPVAKTGANTSSEESWRYPSQSRIVASSLEASAGTLQVLTKGFYSARTPQISYDGKHMLFSGQRHKNDPWQIWEMDLQNRQSRNVTTGFRACTDPAYLPDGRIVFSAVKAEAPDARENRETVAHALYTCALDGSDIERITFHPESDFAPTILRDGRVLFIASKAEPSVKGSKLLAMRYDGMWVELFYESQHSGWQHGRAWEIADGKVIFVESDTRTAFGGRLVAISNSRPLHSRREVAADLEGQFHSSCPLPAGKLIVAYRPTETDRYALYEFDPAQERLERLIYDHPSYHAVEPILAVEHTRPKTIVSLVDPQKKSALIYCLDAHLADLPRNTSARGTKVQVVGQEGVLGEVLLEADGSFYLEVPADRPLRFLTIRDHGEVVRGPSAWLWFRPNEKRGCIGCHEDRELAPTNRRPLAITKPPVPLLSPLTSLVVAGKSVSKEMAK